MFEYEIYEGCKECIKKHIKQKNSFKVQCKPIPKSLMDDDNPYYPLEKILEEETYNNLTEEEKLEIQLKKNPLLWAKEYLGWSTYNKEREYNQFYQKEMLTCSAKMKVMRLGRRMGKCLTTNTKVRTNLGLVKVKNLDKRKHKIFTYDIKNHKIIESENWYLENNGIKQSYEIITESGKKDKVSSNHPYLILINNKKLWKKAEDLKAGDICGVINPLNKEIYYEPIKKVKKIGKKESLCLTTYPHNTIITNDIITHNTEVVTVDALHYCLTNPGKTVIIVGPFQNLIDEIFERIAGLLDNEESVYVGEYDRKLQPNQIKLSNGSIIKGFTTGLDGNSIRGQSGDKFIIDESAYVPPLAYRAILSLLLDNPNVSFTATSTPSAIQTKFKQWCLEDPEWKEFHFKSTMLPYFKDLEATLRASYTGDDFSLEVEADFVETSAKVFKSHNINSASKEYKYYSSFNEEELGERKNWIITIGVDYNEFKNGVQIVVYGFNKITEKFKVLNRISLHANTVSEDPSKNLQTTGVETIKDMYQAFNPEFVYTDEGHGSMQNEILSAYFFSINALHKFKSIDFSSAYEYEDMYTLEIKKKRVKVLMVYFLQKRFELNEIDISLLEEKGKGLLIEQLNEFHIKGFDSKDQPIFGGLDHILDGLILANFAIVENYESLFDKKTGLYIGRIHKNNDKFTKELVEEKANLSGNENTLHKNIQILNGNISARINKKNRKKKGVTDEFGIF